ncbi:MAG: MBL fold metallo-hydrolase [Planctomycetota bacterium JB042]
MIREAAAVLLLRGARSRSAAEVEVFLARRSPKLRFLGGFWAFPGGVKEAGDEDLVGCARREIEEETGLALAADLLDEVGRFVTPPFAPVRYDTVFFRAHVDDHPHPAHDGEELVDGRFFRPSRACEAWHAGELAIAPPVLFVLECLAAHGLEEGLARVRTEGERFVDGRLPPVRFSPGVMQASLRTPTLPPATTTNTYVVGRDELFVVDPATPHADEQERLFDLLDRRVAEGARLAGVLLTHHHEDHVGAAAATAARYGLEVRAHARTLDRLGGDAPRGAPIEDGETIALGRAPDGTDGWTLSALHTPGHARGHLCFLEDRYGALVAGDMVSTVSTIVIDPPEGHLATYLASLERLRAAPGVRIVFPAHGPPFPFGPKIFARYLAHRAEREEKLVAALRERADTAEGLLPRVYDDVAEEVLPIAFRSLLAGLEKLAEDERVVRDGARYALR